MPPKQGELPQPEPPLQSKHGSTALSGKPFLNETESRFQKYGLPVFERKATDDGRRVYLTDPIETNRRYGNRSDAATIVLREVDSFQFWLDKNPHVPGPALQKGGVTGESGLFHEYLKYIGMEPSEQETAQCVPPATVVGPVFTTEGSQVAPAEVK